jgi:hypothetical protein
VGTTADITLSGLQSIDGVTVVTGDRVLVKNQTDQTENGIYNADTSNWSRALDFNGAGDAVKGTRVWVLEGSTFGEEEWYLTTDNPVTIGTDNIVFAQSPLQDAVDAAEAAQAAAEAAAGSVNLPAIGGGDAGKALKVNAGETEFDLTVAPLASAAFLDVGTSANEVVQLDGSARLPAVDGSLLTDLNPPFPRDHFAGLALSLGVDTEHDILIGEGEARDSTNAQNIVLAVGITKQIDAGWSVGDDAGGLDAGSVAGDTAYYIHLIKRSDTGVVDALFSASSSSPTMPANYDYRRLLGRLLTNASANITAGTLIGDGPVEIDNPGLARFWIKCGVTGNILASHNVASVTDVGTGLLDITLGRDFSSTHWACMVTLEQGGSQNVVGNVRNGGQSAGVIQVESRNGSDAVAADPASYYVIGFGAQA